MIRSPAELRQHEHDALQRQVDAWIAAGNRPEVIPRGVSGDNLTPRQRHNPNLMAADVQAKKSAAKAAPAPRASVPAGPRPLKPNSITGRVYAAVKAGKERYTDIVEAVGESKYSVSNALAVLKGSGYVRGEGKKGPGAMVWKPCR